MSQKVQTGVLFLVSLAVYLGLLQLGGTPNGSLTCGVLVLGLGLLYIWLPQPGRDVWGRFKKRK